MFSLLQIANLKLREQVSEKFRVRLGHGLFRILVSNTVFGDTRVEDEDNRKVCALLFFSTMKKIFTLIFLSVLCLNAINAEVTWNLSEDGTLTISGTGDMEDYYYNSRPWPINIKNVIINNGVTSIGQCAFYNCRFLTSITIPNSVTSIGGNAFYECNKLSSITIPNSVTTIGNNAFYKCYHLSSITIPNSVISIGDQAFNYTGLTSIFVESGNMYYDSRNNCNAIIRKSDNTLISGCMNTVIPNGVTSISDYAFAFCDVTSITIPNSVTNIGSNAFHECQMLTSITIPNSVTNIGSLAFYNCCRLTSITIPNSITSIADYAFAYCSRLTSVTIPNSVTIIGVNAFQGCRRLSSVTIPNSVIEIGHSAFAGTGLTSITIPNSVVSIGDDSFNGCALTSITIPNSIASIGERAFYNCINLTSIKVEDENAYYDSRNNCNALIRKSDNTLILGCKNTIIPNSIKNIGDNAFYGCTDITSINIPNSVINICSDAFESCTGITSINIPNSVTSIDKSAFFNCINLKKASIDVNSNLLIGRNVFTASGLEELIMEGESLPKSASEDFANYLYETTTLYVPPTLYDEYCSTSPWNKFKNIMKYSINLTDGETFANEKIRIGQDISYTRTFNNTKWQALYIPFSMSYDNWENDFDVAYINGIRQIDTNNDNVMDETIMDVFKIEDGSLIPNTPYLIRAKTTGEKTISLSEATIYPAENNSIDCSTTIAKYTFTGTYNTIHASTMETNGYYAMGGGSLVMTDGESDLKPFRWYLSVEARSPMYNVSNGAKAITIRVAGEESETTGIKEFQITNDKSPIYDLNGRKVNGSSLKSGLYIKNGKKVVIK